MKKTLSVALTACAAVLIGLGGCGGDNASCRLDIQRDLDKGNFQAVIDALAPEDSACRESYENGNYLLDLTAAYMGKAGIGVSDFITIVLENNDTEESFQGFISSLNNRTGVTSLNPLESASQSLGAFDTDAQRCANQEGYTYLQKDACMYLGIIDTVKASISISSLTTDIDAWIDNTPTDANDVNGNDNPDDMDAAACALQYAVDGSVTPDCNVTTLKDPVDFSNGSSYESVRVDILGTGTNSFFKLITYGDGRSPIITDGNCTVTFEPCDVVNGTDCYVCPAKQDINGTELTVRELVIDGLNGGVDTILGVLGEDSDVSGDVEEYRTEMDSDGDGTISDSELIDYLSAK